MNFRGGKGPPLAVDVCVAKSSKIKALRLRVPFVELRRIVYYSRHLDLQLVWQDVAERGVIVVVQEDSGLGSLGRLKNHGFIETDSDSNGGGGGSVEEKGGGRGRFNLGSIDLLGRQQDSPLPCSAHRNSPNSVFVNARNPSKIGFDALPFGVKGERIRFLQASLVLPLPRSRPLNYNSLYHPSPSQTGPPSMLGSKNKKNQNQNGNARRLLITINVLGSAGPIRFVANEEDLVAAVIDTALKSYAREGRLPILGNNTAGFALYCPHLGSDALSPWDRIGSHGVRNFMLCKKPETSSGVADVHGSGNSTALSRRGSGSWKAWFNKSLNLKISSH
ncbi:hypothetical protein VNO78_11128 [Psophocarpus tetragonolobus]|uniref:DUF7054 domain-containing protein n=1 Tax=Psophocarpus tetragonolobus TaxID=3891 RepID=A0AAN9SLS5_PSOTE